ncbi:hypothetical protein GDI1172 [Gluconacetobacter diazotrophicus PA1 5]|uniref:Uncharacterized protein n=1 Tax=Gluconacetobacter diazotrophicus (strain ATCC 49037 / DSM 5601 / CCUG 37298 / CIP 103539 / LMG 7603 / PAl5) TaxID=272568 RepID=A9HDL0_GLUDA|nr:hypothetical protein GDI1172 [Gluconacetobacter diazotrophicus PA1 5]
MGDQITDFLNKHYPKSYGLVSGGTNTEFLPHATGKKREAGDWKMHSKQ